jgi:hypothetical protein
MQTYYCKADHTTDDTLLNQKLCLFILLNIHQIEKCSKLLLITEIYILSHTLTLYSVVSDYSLDDWGPIPGRGKGFFL